VIWIVSPIWSVMAVKVAAARLTLLAEALAAWLTRQLCATVVAAVASVKVFTTVELCGELPEMSVTAPAAAANPLVVSSAPFWPAVPPATPQSPLVAAVVVPVEPSPAVGAVTVLDMATKLKLQLADTVQKPSLFDVTNCSTYFAPVLKSTLWVDWHCGVPPTGV